MEEVLEPPVCTSANQAPCWLGWPGRNLTTMVVRRRSALGVEPSALTHEVVELATIALLVLVFTLLLDVFFPVSQISFTALLEEVDVSVSPTSSVVSEDVFSLLDELFPFSTIFIWLIDATEDLLSLLLLSVEVLDTAETVEEEIVVLAVSVTSDLAAVSVVAFLVLFVSFFILLASFL